MDFSKTTEEAIDAWAENLNAHFSFMAKMFEEAAGLPDWHFISTDATQKEEMDVLKEDFKKQFGIEGQKALATIITSPKLNGGDDPEKEQELFPGMHYSLPTSFYFIRRALDATDEETSYLILLQDIQASASKHGVDIYRTLDEDHEVMHVPSQDFMDDLIRPYLDDLDLAQEEMDLSTTDQEQTHDL